MEPIAIVGLAFKLPQDIEDEASFWHILEQGQSMMTEWPKSRVDVNAFARLPEASLNTVGSDQGIFDAPFFSISSKEASAMDPQQRMLLETSYHALENAGIPLSRIAGTVTGVFVGTMESDYHRTISKDPDDAPMTTATGISVSIMANRLSWYFDLKGPSMQLNTACSSSMIAVDLGCQSIRSGQSSTVLVAGSSLMLDPEYSLYLSNMNMLSPDGICHSFDDRANGYSRGEGVIVMILKKLSTAISDGDNIRAVIRGTGSNQDGRTPGITQPSSVSQENLIRHTYRTCNLGFESTRYIEAHGTGTQIGDAMEMRALGAVFRTARSPRAPLFVGSVKTNIGHLEGGSGLAGIAKSILILEKGFIPPNALFERLNTKVPASCIRWPGEGLRRISVNSFGFGGSNAHAILDDAYHTLETLSSRDSLRSIETPRVALPATSNGHRQNDVKVMGSVSEENVDGPTSGIDDAARANGVTSSSTDVVALTTNNGLSAILIETDTQSTQGSEKTDGNTVSDGTSPNYRQILIFTARDEAALKRIHQQYAEYYDRSIAGAPRMLDDLAYTLAARRNTMAMRSFTVAGSDSSSSSLGLPNLNCVRSSGEPQLCFVFTGQGAQYAKMGLELIDYPVFKDVLTQADRVFQSTRAEWSLFDEMKSGERIDLPQFSQPLCTALQIALVELLKSFHIAPVAVVGHSSGEIAAAYAIGALSLESACRISYHRGRLSGQLAAQLAASMKTGAMMSANLQEGQVRAYVDKYRLDAKIRVACVNSPSNVTLAGPEADVDALKRHLDDDRIFAQKLNTGIAYHTVVMNEMAQEYVSCLNDLVESTPRSCATLMVSSVTGQRVTAMDLCTAQYWADNLTSPVRFLDALQYLAIAAPKLDGIKAISDYIEVGPHGALRRPIKETLSQVPNYRTFAYVSVLSKLVSPVNTTMEVAGHLFTRGYPVSIAAVNRYTDSSNLPMLLSDTPKYPFDRTQQHWFESRLSRDWRLRGAAPRSVLGIRVTDWNPLEPRWRKMLSTQETPWIAEHVVSGVIVFPAAGMIVMALEAVKQTVQSHQTLSAFLVKEATFATPIFVDTERKTEVVTQLRPIKAAYEREALRFDVIIFSIDDNGRWTECFKATVHAQPKTGATSEVDGGLEARETAEACVSRYKEAKLSCTKRISSQDFYEWLDKQGLSYGEAFALSKDIFWDGSELCVSRVDNSEEPYEGVVHPTVLDNCLQLCCTAPSGGMTKKLSTFIPSSMRDLWVSATGWQHPQTDSIRIMTQAKPNIQMTGLNCSMMAFSEPGQLLCDAKHLGMSAVAGKASADDNQKRLVHSIDWRPQLSLLTKQQLSEHCRSDNKDDEISEIEYCVSLEDAIRARLQRVLPQLQGSVEPGTPAHLKRFVMWVERQLRQTPGKAADEVSDAQLGLRLERLRESRPSWRLCLEVLENLPSIIRGETDALDLLFTTPVAHDLYDAFFRRTCNKKLFSYLELTVHQNPNQKILEVGAGTGGMTNQILTMLHQIEQRTGGTSFREYVYTDISPAYFEGARERFANYGSRMTFKTIDLESDISANIEPGSCDMILAGSVLHATKNLAKTMRNLRRALKPGGQLVFLEITQAPECFPMSFGFGVLPGWWCAEETSREWCPTLTEMQWDVLLKETGFTGNELLVKDYEDPRANYVTIITSTAEKTSKALIEVSRVLLIINDHNEQQENLARAVSTAISASFTCQVIVFTLSHIAEADVGPSDCILFLADMQGSILAEPSKDEFRLVQTWLQQSKHLLWVTAALTSQQFSPCTSIKDGLLRVIRAENNSKRIISLTLEHDASDIQICQQCIVQVFRSAFEDASPELEYTVRDGKIMTGRLVFEAGLNRDVVSCMSPITRHEAWLPGPPLKLHVASRGSLESLCFIEDEYPTNLHPTEVEIETQAWAVGFRDVFGALGRLDENEFGTDCAGKVRRVGSKCTQLRPGDRVSTSMFGCMRTYVYCDEGDAIKVPDTLSLEEACGVINPVMTAWHSLVDVARLQKGEKILIHAASGGTGQVAIQVAQMLGAEVYATVGYDHKKELLIKEYGIPAANIFYSRDLSFAQGIMRVTNGYGVDVVLNSLVGEGQRSSWECVAPYGRFVEIGKADIYANSPLPMASFANNRSFSAVDLRDLAFHRPEASRALFHKTMNLVQEKAIFCPTPLNKFPVSAIEDAFRYMQTGRSTGRVIVTLDHGDVKNLILRPTWKFDPEAAYLVVGGLGGVGRSILRWMISRGAKQLIVPSRSGPRGEAAFKIVIDAIKSGVTILTPSCDVSDMASLKLMLDECAPVVGPIRGCINAAMVLQDSIFDNMTHAQWKKTIDSKVKSSWNVHALLPNDLDFFILLSSAAGVLGNAGQSNYAAGCTFQDALSSFRKSFGRKAVSIDLGLMSTVGFVAENEGVKKTLERYEGLRAIEEAEFLALMDILCDLEHPPNLSTINGQVTMGITTPADLALDNGTMPMEHMHQSLFAYFVQTEAMASSSMQANGVNSAALFRQAESVEEMGRIVVESLVRKIARALSMSLEDVDTDKALHLYGVDSLVAVEIRNWITKEFMADVPVFELMSGKSILAIAQLVTKNSQIRKTVAKA
ncbi:unnamed protein product [Alternaria alternata]